jgi:hypothetical protein
MSFYDFCFNKQPPNERNRIENMRYWCNLASEMFMSKVTALTLRTLLLPIGLWPGYL